MTKKRTSKSREEVKKMSFEEAIRSLTEIVEKIETGQVPLQESLQQYEKGMQLIGQCRQILQDAERRIAEIETKDYSAKNRRSGDKEENGLEDKDQEEERLF